MTTDTYEDFDARLTNAGRQVVPAADSTFADQLDAQLRVSYAGRRQGRPRARASLAVAASAVVAAVVLVFALRADDPSTLTLTTAVATDVVLPNGSVVVGEAGLALPDGSLVRTGAGGSASAGGVLVPGGATAVVTDGALVLLDDDERSSTNATGRSSSTVRRDSSAPTRVPTTRTPQPSSIPPASRPTTTQLPASTTTARPTTTSVLASTTTAPPVRLELRANRQDREVLLTWSIYDRPDFAHYVVVRIQDDRSDVVAELTESGATAAVDHPPAGTVAYRVVALDDAGRVVGASPVVSP